jgi:hypothetical protein
VSLRGRLEDSLGSGQQKELRVESVQILGECDPEVRIMLRSFLVQLSEMSVPS